MSEARTTFVYFIQPEGGGLIKIGRADDPERRLRLLQCGSPVILKLCHKAEAPAEWEFRLHTLFQRYRKHGEWFEPCQQLADIANAIPDPAIPDRGLAAEPMGELDPGLRAQWLENWERGLEEGQREQEQFRQELQRPYPARPSRWQHEPLTALPDDVDPEWHWDHVPKRRAA